MLKIVNSAILQIQANLTKTFKFCLFPFQEVLSDFIENQKEAGNCTNGGSGKSSSIAFFYRSHQLFQLQVRIAVSTALKILVATHQSLDRLPNHPIGRDYMLRNIFQPFQKLLF